MRESERERERERTDLPTHCEMSSNTVMAAEWIVAFLEARLGRRAVMTLVITGVSVFPSRGTMLLNASSAARLTLLLRSVSRRLKASNTCMAG